MNTLARNFSHTFRRFLTASVLNIIGLAIAFASFFVIMTGKAVIMLKNQDPNQGGIDYMTINMWSPFEANNFSDCKVINDCRPEHTGKHGYPVRLEK